jgi:FKBP-type peptidyl-prolyl cis-trans isomerase
MQLALPVLWAVLAGPLAAQLVAANLEDVTVGQGEALAPGGVYEATCTLWWEDFDAVPLSEEPIEVHGQLGRDQYPGLTAGLPGMREGGVRRWSMPILECFGNVVLNRNGLPTMGTVYLEVHLRRIWPAQRAVVETVREGTGPALATGEYARIEYTIWLDRYEGDEVLDTSREHGPSCVGVGTHQANPGWDVALAGMRVGEVRKVVLPWYLTPGHAVQGWSDTHRPPLHYRLELLAIHQPGTHEVATVQEGHGPGVVEPLDGIWFEAEGCQDV